MVGGCVFQFGGCNPEVRGTLLDGLEGTTTALLTTLVTVLFDTLEDNGTGGGTGTLTTT
jgi:hypothetical protein